MELLVAKEFLVAVALGFMIGLQRELSFLYNNKKIYIGARTFALISLLGYLSTKLYDSYPEILTLTFIFIGIFLVAFYIINAYSDKFERGNTTEISALLALIIGILITKYMVLAIFSTVMLIAILEIKHKLLYIKEEIKEKDFRATVLFLLMTFVVLPILPDKAIDPYGVFNPTQIWMMVILICGVSFVGYLATRFVDISKGLLLVGFLGGFTSSTAVTLTLSKKATQNKEANKSIIIAIALASSTMFFRVILWTFVLNKEIFSFLVTPYLVAIFVGYILIYIIYKQTDQKEVSTKISFENPLEFMTAMKMGVVFGVIFGVVSLMHNNFGTYGVYIASFVSGLSDIDAVVLSLGNLFNSHEITKDIVLLAIVLATVANTITKLIISFVIGNIYIGLHLLYIFAISLGVLGATFYFTIF